jgi:hypothetical protein
VGFVTICVILLVELGLDKHPCRPFVDAKFNLDHIHQLILITRHDISLTVVRVRARVTRERGLK